MSEDAALPRRANVRLTRPAAAALVASSERRDTDYTATVNRALVLLDRIESGGGEVFVRLPGGAVRMLMVV